MEILDREVPVLTNIQAIESETNNVQWESTSFLHHKYSIDQVVNLNALLQTAFSAILPTGLVNFQNEVKLFNISKYITFVNFY